ncbi:transposase family protein [Pseudonocardia kujensis]|uniref:transposase family protein n=1 Tax=Pseudonocardia kujensis TaxID=1128675 RepID=UPI001E3D95E6|nr:transposase family protein [Pseudonocardia kujensis]MCE0762092.1 transposase family protein [Pseudonocardia kujensis]
MAYLRRRETYAGLACGFETGASTVYRHIREALDLLIVMTPTLERAIEVVKRKAFVGLDGTVVRIDPVGMASDYDRAFYSGKHKTHGLIV